MANIGIKVDKKGNIYDAVLYYFDAEKVEYDIIENDSKKYQTMIYVTQDVKSIKPKSESIIVISDKKEIIENSNSVINYIITPLLNDDINYSSTQKEYLFKKGIYSIFIQKMGELIENVNSYNGLIYDLTAIKKEPYNWVFKFGSINETYAWLSKMNRAPHDSFIEKKISFYSEKVYDDSVREINYLTELLINIKNKKKLIDIFILTKEQLEKMKTNYFFKSLVKNISDTYQMYWIDEKEIVSKDENLLEKLRDGIIVFEDCIYRDTYDDEFSLGYVDCKPETFKEYNEYVDYIIEKYGHLINAGGEVDV